jgi:DNA invertase Pin-like site-specific DNA recombinase
VTLVKGADLDLSSAAGRAVAGLMGEFDTTESEIKAERVASAALQRAERSRIPEVRAADGSLGGRCHRRDLLDYAQLGTA